MMSRSQNELSTPDPARINSVIYVLTFLMELGRYLRWVELAFGFINSIYAVLNFLVWNEPVAGIINVLLAIGSFIFFAQLIPKRKRYQRSVYVQAVGDGEENETRSSKSVRDTTSAA